MVRGCVICDALADQLDGREYEVQVHSVFQKAVNFTLPAGLVTLLAPEKGVQPFSVVSESPFFTENLPKAGMRMESAGIFKDGERIISFEGAERIHLGLDHRPEWRAEAPGTLLAFLESHKDKGLVEMAFGGQCSIYARFLAPKLEDFRMAARQKKPDEAVAAAGRMVGCGIGLTPSSDDLLCGYLAGMQSVWPESLSQRTADRAASGTNYISGALLRHAGAGRFSRDILQLVHCLENVCTVSRREWAMEKVAGFGSSSGYDFLTGLYFGILDALETV